MRTYSKGELASLYMPEASVEVARGKLVSWIKHNKELEKELISAGYTRYAKLLTPKQVGIIYQYLGRP